MDPASFAFATLGAAEICLNCCKTLSSKYRSFRHREDNINDMILTLDNHAITIQYQTQLLSRIWSSLDGHVQIHQNQLLHGLQMRLQAALVKIDSLIGAEKLPEPSIELIRRKLGEIKRFKYLAIETSLKETLKDLESWQRMFDPTWFLIARLTPLVDEILENDKQSSTSITGIQSNAQWLRKLDRSSQVEAQETPNLSIFIPATSVQDVQEPISMTSMKLARASGRAQELIIDTRTYTNEQDVRRVEKDLQNFVRALRDADPRAFGILRCQGVIKTEASDDLAAKFELVFEVPNGFQDPISLRKLLTQEAEHTLTDRIQLARLLARSMISIHTANFVHKNISPDTIIVLRDPESSLGTPFIMGFDTFRNAEGQTYYSGDLLWEKNFYRHPKRQGNVLSEEYVMQHDIYSLGVCLLEIGLWTSFVMWDETSPETEPQKGQVPKDIEADFGRELSRAGFGTKQKLTDLAKIQLPPKMGKIYSDVVHACLTCLDRDNTMFGNNDELLDADGILLGVRYAEKVLVQLENISM